MILVSLVIASLTLGGLVVVLARLRKLEAEMRRRRGGRPRGKRSIKHTADLPILTDFDARG